MHKRLKPFGVALLYLCVAVCNYVLQLEKRVQHDNQWCKYDDNNKRNPPLCVDSVCEETQWTVNCSGFIYLSQHIT